MTPKIIRVLGKSNSGKTTFIEKLLQMLPSFNIAVIKHTNHILDMPNNQKDTSKQLIAGAKMVAGVSPTNGEIFFQKPCMLDFYEIINLFSKKSDLVLIEGAREYDFKTILIGSPPENALLDNVILKLENRPKISKYVLDTITAVIKE